MSDRKLLEMAAKAIGLPERGWMGPAFMYVKDNTLTDWNPLTDDGDALRLAVQLEADVVWFRNTVAVTFRCPTVGTPGTHDTVQEPRGTDSQVAVRRAIVRAAAQIGKAMQ